MRKKRTRTKPPPRRPLTIRPALVVGGRCPYCGERAQEIYDLKCACCNFAEQCCRSCASPPALRALSEVLLYRSRQEQKVAALIEREHWEGEDGESDSR